MKKIKGFIIGFSIVVFFIIVYVCIYTSYYLTNNIILFLINYLFLGILFSMAFGVLICIPVILVWIFLDSKIKISKTVKVSVQIILLVILLNIGFYHTGYEYTLDNNIVNGVELVLRMVSDVVSRETIDIKTNVISLTKERVRISLGPKPRRFRGRVDWYLKINNGEYVIPVPSQERVEKLLYEETSGKKAINTITVYKNSKFIKAINGVKLSEDKGFFELIDEDIKGADGNV